MGCTSSKLDDLPAVALCRAQCAFLDEAIHQHYVLAEAHVAYMHSLKGVGVSLHHFFGQDLDNSTVGPPSPILNLPTQRKRYPEKSGSPLHTAAIHHQSRFDSGHLHLPSNSDLEDSGSSSLHHNS